MNRNNNRSRSAISRARRAIRRYGRERKEISFSGRASCQSFRRRRDGQGVCCGREDLPLRPPRSWRSTIHPLVHARFYYPCKSTTRHSNRAISCGKITCTGPRGTRTGRGLLIGQSPRPVEHKLFYVVTPWPLFPCWWFSKSGAHLRRHRYSELSQLTDSAAPGVVVHFGRNRRWPNRNCEPATTAGQTRRSPFDRANSENLLGLHSHAK
jgi:hypothetical protein